MILVSEIPFLASVTNCYTSKMQYSPHFMRLHFSLNYSILTVLGQWFFHTYFQPSIWLDSTINIFRQSSNFVKPFRRIVN